MEYWTKEQLDAIDKILNPRSMAVVGASERSRYGERFLTQVLRCKDKVRVYPVNPNYKDIKGIPCYPTVADLPETPDLVAVLVPCNDVLDTLRMSHAKGTRAAIVVSGGFAERGTESGRDLQRQLGEFARQSGLRICGPNCLGVANVKDDIWATATSKNPSGLTGHIGLVCQSGATAFGPFVSQAADNGFGFSHIISTGNEADLDFTDFARNLLDDEATHVIGGFVEGFRDARKLIALAELAAQRNKPLVVIKIGRSESGTRAALSHTAALTGSDRMYDALFKQYGIIRVDDYSELLDVANLLAHEKRSKQRGIAIVSSSGGVGSSTADICGHYGLDVPPLSDKARKGINDILNGRGWASNPADVTGFARSEEFPKIMDYIIEEPEVGTLVIASNATGKHIGQVEQLIALDKRSPKRIAYLWISNRGDETGLAMLKNAGIPTFYSPAIMARAFKKTLDYQSWREAHVQVTGTSVPAQTAEQKKAFERVAALGLTSLSENESKQLISAWGVPSTREIAAPTADAAAAAAQQLGFPVALKVDSSDVLHKTEAGAVKLGLRSADEVRSAYADIISSAKRYAPSAKIAGVLVQEMVTGGVEVIAGVSYDPQVGPMLLFGIGGVMVEIYNDIALRRCPINRKEATTMISEVPGAKLLQGFRGSPPADIDALADTLVRISQMAVHLDGHLTEFDINPLAVLAKGKGVKALDALAVLQA